MEQKKYIVTASDAERLDKYVSGQIPDLSRTYIQKLIKEEKITVNGTIEKASFLVSENDLVTMEIPDLTEPDIIPENIPLDILYEDQDLLIVNKPKGMVVHPSAGHYTGTLVNALMYYCKQDLSGINGVLRPGIVHRIDRDTTGSLIVCKNDSTHQAIAAQLKEHSVIRKYHAIVSGCLSQTTGTIEAPIGRHPTDRKKMAVNERNGKPAVTHYTVLKQFQNYTYIECRLETGRTHQIRVHMAHIRHPLLGDTVYGAVHCPFPNLEGQTLHAKSLGLIHPRTGVCLEIDTPLPVYFQELLQRLQG